MKYFWRRVAAGVLAAVMVTSSAAAAGSNIRVLLDGQILTESAYIDENCRTQAPMEVADRLGISSELTIGDTAGDTTVVEGYIPLRYVAEAYGYSVAWDADTVYLTSPGAGSQAVTNLPKLDMGKWQYHADDNVWYQIGIATCETPADERYEKLAIFVPGPYLTGTDNGDGTYACQIDPSATVNGYTADTAPMVMPIETPGYSAMAALTAYTNVSQYTDAGFVYLYAGCRGREHGAPLGVTDLKAAIRYARYIDDVIPGDAERIFVFGMSGGGAQSALVGATGDSALYDPYLAAIGAVQGVSDAVLGSMDWCPITNLDSANEAYEWMMGVTRSGLTGEEQAISDALAAAFADYINAAQLRDREGNVLTLTTSEEGIYRAGSYYDLILSEIEISLNNFLSDTTFPYDASASGGGFGGHGGFGDRFGDFGDFDHKGGDFGGFGNFSGPGGFGSDRDESRYEDMDDIFRTETASRIELSGTFETAKDYIDALNAQGQWVTYDATTNTASVTSVDDFVKAFKPASKGLAAFDQLDAGQGENVLFGYGDGSGAHFDGVLANILAGLGSEYADDYAADLARTDALGNTAQQRLDMYTPLYYLLESQEGYHTSTPAKYWRIRSGIAQSDTAITTEVNLALALENYEGVEIVDFAAVWGQQHTKAERTGDSDANFINWVMDCLAR